MTASATVLTGDVESGLICGFRAAGGRFASVAWSEIEAALASKGPALWLHFNAADRRSQHFLAHTTAIPDDARDFLLARDSRARVETIEGGLAAAFLDLRVGTEDDPSETGMVRLWCTDGLLLTTRHIPLATLDGFRRTVDSLPVTGNAFHLLLALLALFQARFARLIAELELNFGTLEDAILAERFLEQGGELGRLRRRIVHLRRLVNPQHHAVHALVARPPAWIDGDGRERLQDLEDRLAAAAQELDHMAEGARLLQEEQASRLAEATNRNLYFLSLLSAIFLPMTLVAGVFGMNVAGMPGLEDAGGFWWVVLGLAGVGAASLVILRWRGMI